MSLATAHLQRHSAGMTESLGIKACYVLHNHVVNAHAENVVSCMSCINEKFYNYKISKLWSNCSLC